MIMLITSSDLILIGAVAIVAAFISAGVTVTTTAENNESFKAFTVGLCIAAASLITAFVTFSISNNIEAGYDTVFNDTEPITATIESIEYAGDTVDLILNNGDEYTIQNSDPTVRIHTTHQENSKPHDVKVGDTIEYKHYDTPRSLYPETTVITKLIPSQ